MAKANTRGKAPPHSYSNATDGDAACKQALTMKAMLSRLTRFGSSLEISWCEDDKLWTVAWISAGKRFVMADKRLETALDHVWVAAAVYAAAMNKRDRDG
jgi:hypothetical protein